MMTTLKLTLIQKLLLLTCIIMTTACSTAYYATWEKLGKHKRDLLRDNVETAQEEQLEAQEQFKDALTRLKELSHFDGGKLEKTYNALKDDYEECQEATEEISDRINTIDEIANDLFTEWQTEIELITNTKFQADSRKKLKQTRKKYTKLHKSMRQSEKRMQSVLVRFKDHVLYLKHNLNAQAIGGLEAEVGSIEMDVQKLIKDMQTSIREADSFINTL